MNRADSATPGRVHFPAAWLLVLSLLSLQVQALSSDAEQPIEVEANAAEIDDRKGLVVYTGKVVVTQGSIRISGDQVTLKYDDNKQLSTLVVLGKPARFRQRPDQGKEYLRGSAKRLEYMAKRERLKLIDEARVVDGGKEIRGHHIDYDTRRHTAKAQGEAGASGTPTGRVRITIPKARK